MGRVLFGELHRRVDDFFTFINTKTNIRGHFKIRARGRHCNEAVDKKTKTLL